MVRLFHRVAIAIFTLVVGLGIAGPRGGNAGLFAAVVDVATTAQCAAIEDEQSGCWEDNTARAAFDLKAFESDVDDDDDALCDVPNHATLDFRSLPPPSAEKPTGRGELQLDTSRFAAGPGLPRGPPV